MSDGRFSLPAWHRYVGAQTREQSPLRQDLVRGLKDYFESVYGYDRFGAETIFQLEERLAEPYIYGFALKRILHDRRVSDSTRACAARWAIEHVRYAEEGGIPFGFPEALTELARSGELTVDEMRFALTASAGEQQPFRGMDKRDGLRFLKTLLDMPEMPEVERVFWAHSLLARHRDESGAIVFVDALLGDHAFSRDVRVELCQAWLHFRQPRLDVSVPPDDQTERGAFVASHMPFWLAHAPAWPSLAMVRRAPVWLARLSGEPIDVAEKYLVYRGPCADQVHQGAADVLLEYAPAIDPSRLQEAIDMGLRAGVCISARRSLYRAGMEAFGGQYLNRAREDASGSVRAWAARQHAPVNR